MAAIFLTVIKLTMVTLLGYFLYKKKIIEEKLLKLLTFFVVNVSVPCLIVSRLIQNARIVLAHSILGFLFLSAAIFLIGWLLSWRLSLGKPRPMRDEYMGLVSFQNCGYLPMNMALFMFPPEIREEFLVYVFLYLLGFNLLMWSLAGFLFFKKPGQRFRLKSMFSLPVVSTILSLILVYSRAARHFPALIIEPMKLMGDTSFALSMILLGCALAQTDTRRVRENLKALAQVSFLKLAAIPVLAVLITAVFKIFSLLGLFIVLQAAVPSATTLTIIANMQGSKGEFTSQGILVTHVLSIITIPLWLEIFSAVSGTRYYW